MSEIPEDREELPLDVLNAAVDLCRVLTLSPTPASVRPIARAILAERERCLGLANGWILAHGETLPEWVDARQWATDAVADIADAIQEGVPAPAQSHPVFP